MMPNAAPLEERAASAPATLSRRAQYQVEAKQAERQPAPGAATGGAAAAAAAATAEISEWEDIQREKTLQLRRRCKDLGMDRTGGRAELLGRLKPHF